MKKLVAVLLLALSSTAYAGGNHHNRHYNHHRHYNWVAPAVIGGAIVYGLSRPTYVAPPPPPVYYTQPYPAPQPVCTRYVYQDQYGNVQREEVRCN